MLRLTKCCVLWRLNTSMPSSSVLAPLLSALDRDGCGSCDDERGAGRGKTPMPKREREFTKTHREKKWHQIEPNTGSRAKDSLYGHRRSFSFTTVFVRRFLHDAHLCAAPAAAAPAAVGCLRGGVPCMRRGASELGRYMNFGAS
jgi:hypothetical protein